MFLVLEDAVIIEGRALDDVLLEDGGGPDTEVSGPVRAETIARLVAHIARHVPVYNQVMRATLPKARVVVDRFRIQCMTLVTVRKKQVKRLVGRGPGIRTPARLLEEGHFDQQPRRPVPASGYQFAKIDG